MRTKSIIPLLAVACLAGWAPAHAAEVTTDYIVSFRDGVSKSQRDDWVRQSAGRLMHEFRTGNAVWVRLPAGRAANAELLLADPRVAHLESDAAGVPDLVPDDPLYPNQPHLRNTACPDVDIQAEPAWDLRHDAPAVTVAVIDDGFLLGHPDLAANFVPGYDCADGDADPSPDPVGTYYAHGTGVTGLLAAVGDNGIGVAGVCWDLRVMPLKHHRSGSPWYSGSVATAAAVDRAVAAGVDAIVCSFHYPGDGLDVSPDSQFYRSFRAASDAGIVVVASAGNDGRDLDDPANARYPASFDFANVVTVAMIGPDGLVPPDASAHGGDTVEIAAPGFAVHSTWVGADREPTYLPISGTSAAAPLVAGALALIKAARPDLPYPAGVLALLYARAETSAANGEFVSGGRSLNLYRALAEPDLVPPGGVDDLAVTGLTDTAITLRWTEPGEDGAAGLLDHFALAYRAEDRPSVPVLGLPAPAGPGTVHSVTVAGLPWGSHVDLAVTAVDEYRNRTSVPIAVDMPGPLVSATCQSAFFMARTGALRDSTVVFRNAGNWEGVLTALRLSGGDWLKLPADPLRVAAGDSVALPYACDASGLAAGFYTAQFGVLGTLSGPITITLLVLDAPPAAATPAVGEVRVWECFPNPLNPRTRIRFSLREGGAAVLRIFDLRGALVRTIPLGVRSPGLGTADWAGDDDDGRALPSGAYFCRLMQSGKPVYPALKLNLVR